MPMASLNEQITAISLYYDSGMCFDQFMKYLHVQVNTSVCMADQFAVAVNIDPVEF